jgi:stage IV sporulation protein B
LLGHNDKAGGKAPLVMFKKGGEQKMEQERKKKTGTALLACVLAVVLICGLAAGRAGAVETAGVAILETPRKAASSAGQTSAVGAMVVPMGKAVGVKLFSDGVLVVGLASVETEDGACYPGRDCGLKAGDVITHINGSEVDTIEEVQTMVSQQEGEPLTIQAQRGTRSIQLQAEPAENEQGNYQLGVWLRDSMAGIGTLTFYDPSSGVFGALGHGINDVDTATLMPLQSGTIMPASVAEVKKGLSGQPGELHGEFDLTRDLGTLSANTELGIFGTLAADACLSQRDAVPVASLEQIHEGDATILSNIRGDDVEEFQIRITRVSSDGDGTRALTLQVTDPDLLQTTGGIVQGMSGSPILQDGRLVGAVTHVLVNDPTRGYGILAQRMLEQAAQG